MAALATSTPVPSRRGLFALAALPALAFASPPAGGADMLALERQRAALLAAANLAKTEAETDALIDATVEIECRIAEAPCDSHAALLVKLRTVVRTDLVDGRLYAIDHAALIDGMVRFLEVDQ